MITAVQPVAARASSTALSGTVPGIVPVVHGASSEPQIGSPSLTKDVRDMPPDDAAAVPAHQAAVVDSVGLDAARVLHGTASLPLSGSPRESSDPDHVAANGPAISPPGRGSAPDDVTEVWTEPLGRNLYRLHVTVTQAFMEKLEAARDALAFKKIRRKADVLEAALDIVLARQAKRRGETNRPQQNPRSSTDPTHIPARVKRAVGKRDGWRCQFPTDSGGICGSKRHIQFDHIVPSTLGGPSTIENVRVLCATHNVVAARLALGDHVMDRYTQRGRRGQATPAANDAPNTERYSENETG